MARTDWFDWKDMVQLRVLIFKRLKGKYLAQPVDIFTLLLSLVLFPIILIVTRAVITFCVILRATFVTQVQQKAARGFN